MSAVLTRTVSIGLSFLLIFASGIWMSASGKPYGSGLFAVHKLVGVAVGVLLGVIVYQAHKVAPLDTLQVAAIVLTVLFFSATVIAGSLLSVDLQVPGIVRKLHQVVPVLTVLATAGMLYLLVAGR